MKTPSRFISGLDIQKNYLSVAQYSPVENAVLLLAIQPLMSDENRIVPWERASDDLKELKSRFKFYSADIICSVPSEYAIVKYIGVEKQETDIEDFIEWELSQQLIGPLEDYFYDYQESSFRGADGLREYLAVAYRNEIVTGYSSMLKAVKLNPLVVDLDVFALINVFEANYSEFIGKPTVLVHGEGEKTKLVFTHDGHYLDSDYFEYGYGTFDPQMYAERIYSEISRFCALNGCSEKSVATFLTGSLFSQMEYVDSMKGLIVGSEILHPFRKVGCRVGVDDEKLMSYLPQLSIAVGLALRGND